MFHAETHASAPTRIATALLLGACLACLVTASAATTAATSGPTTGASVSAAPPSDSNVTAGGDACGTVENVTIPRLTESLEVRNGSIEGLAVQGAPANLTVHNGTVLLSAAATTVESAAFDDTGFTLADAPLRVRSGSLFVRNASATVDGERMSLDDRRINVPGDATGEAVIVTGVTRLDRPPGAVLANSTIGALSIHEYEGELRMAAASRDVLGLVGLRMDAVELSGGSLSPTFEDVHVRDGQFNASTVTVDADDATLSLGELAVTSGDLTSRSDDVETDLEGGTVTFTNVSFETSPLADGPAAAC